MLWLKALHIIFVITWFAGLFYLPRLFVYHAMSADTLSLERFKIMERKLYCGITLPSAILATLSGVAMIGLNPEYYLRAHWMQAKLVLVGLLWIYQFVCDYYRRQFNQDANTHSHQFYRWFNEFPVVILIGVVILVVIKP